ncbi:hypothetical protein D3C87_1905350 [compost metagenome]
MPGQRDLALLDGFQPVDGADQCRLAGAGRAAENGRGSLGYRRIDIAQHLQGTEPLGNVLELDHATASTTTCPVLRDEMRRSSQFVAWLRAKQRTK